MVSDWIWLYWVVAVALTVIVMAGWYGFSRRANHELQRSFAPTLPDAESLAQLPRNAESSDIQQRPTPIPAIEKSVLEVSSQTSLPFGSDRSRIYRTHDKTNSASAHPEHRVFGRGTLEEPLKPIRPIPSSKITNMGVKDSVDTCPCCARTLA